MLDFGNKFLLVLFILPLLYELNNCERNFGVGIYYMNYTAGQRYNFSVFNYKYYNVNNKIVVYVDFKSDENLPSLIAHVKLDILRANNNKINLLNTVQDMCKIMNGVHNVRLVKVISEQIMRTTNMECPFLANKKYVVNNYTLEPEMLPAFTPPLHWVIQTQFIFGNKSLGFMTLHGLSYTSNCHGPWFYISETETEIDIYFSTLQ